MSEIVEGLRQQLAHWEKQYYGQPEKELEQLLLLALEREEIVAVGYRESLIAQRLRRMPVEQDARELIQRALVWIWQDEAMHAVFVRGAILKLGRRLLAWRARARGLAGVLGGWAGSIQQHLQWRHAPLSRALARMITDFGVIAGAMPGEVKRYLEYRPFRDYCLWNVEAEQTAWLSYQRILEVASSAALLPDRLMDDLARVQRDESSHAAVFQVIADCLDDQDRLRTDVTILSLRERIAQVGEFFSPKRPDPENPVGAGGDVVIATGRSSDEQETVLIDALNRAELPQRIMERCQMLGKSPGDLRVVIKPTFMMGYSRRDPSPIVAPDLLKALGKYLYDLGCRTISVVESSKIYERFFRNRAVHQVAEYLDLTSTHYRIVDLTDDQVPHGYRRGLGQDSIGRAWKDADFRIDFSKMRSHPIDRVALTLANIEGLGSCWADYIFADRLASYYTAILMVLDEFPPHFALLDAYENAPDGPLGVMGSAQPRQPRRIYAAWDALSLDIVAARHMGLADPLDSPLIRSACYWFGDPRPRITVRGADERVAGWHGPCYNDLTALFGIVAQFVYQSASGHGAVFTPEMDTAAFPPATPVGFPLRLSRKAIHFAFGLRVHR